MNIVRMITFMFYLLQSFVCNGEDFFNSTDGVVQSPITNRGFYPRNLRKTWRITVREKFIIRLVFMDFSLQQRNSKGVCLDRLEIYDGEDGNSPKIFDECGEISSNTLVFSSGNQLFLKMKTNNKNQKTGFSANFRSVPLILRMEEINATEGMVRSPNYPKLYPNYLSQIWRIVVKEKFIIRLVFTDFNLQQEQYRLGLCPDKLQIYNGEDENNPRIFTKCGEQFNLPPIFSSSNHLLIKLTTNGVVRKRGFSANFTSVPLMEEINAAEGVVQSINFPGLYPNYLTQTWRITVREASTIRLLFTDFNLQEKRHQECRDKLQIYDGHNEESEKIFDDCGGPFDNLSPVVSSGNKLFLKLITDRQNQRKGFSATFTSVLHIETASSTTSTMTTITGTDKHKTYSLLETATPFDASSSLTESNSKLPHNLKFSDSTAPGLYVVVPSVGVVLCLLAFGLFVILKKSTRKSLPPTSNYTNQDATPTNPDSNVPEQQGYMSEGCSNGPCNATPLREIATRNNPGEEDCKGKASASSEGEIRNIVYESYDNKVNEKVDLEGKDVSLVRSDIVCYEYDDVTKQNATYEAVDDKRSVNIIYESYDDKTNEEMELKGENFMLTKSDKECHEDDDVTKQNTTYEAVDHNQPDNDVYDEVRPTEDKGLEVNIIYEPYEGNR